MDKRQFITTATLCAAALPASAARPTATQRGPTLLTITGDIARSNRGAFDPAMDQMMAKHKIRFDKAWTFDFATLAALPATRIKPTLEYDGKPHALAGPLLVDVLKIAGVPTAATTAVLLRAVDGYAVRPTLGDVAQYRFILATHVDGSPLPLGGLGPLWAVYDADRIAEMAARPLAARFGLCPWATYHIDVQAA